MVNAIFKCLCKKRHREERLSTQSDESFTIATNPLHAIDKTEDHTEKIREMELQAKEKDKHLQASEIYTWKLSYIFCICR